MKLTINWFIQLNLKGIYVMSITDALTSSPQSLIDETKVLSNGSCNGIYNGIAHEETHKNLSVCNGQNKSLQNNVEHKTEPDMHFHMAFPLLAGENVGQVTRGKEAHVILTNFRLFVSVPQCFYNIPVKAIEYVEMRELLNLFVYCKDGKVTRISFDSAEECSEWWRHITSSEAHQTKSEDLFAFKYFQLMKANPPFSSFSVDSDEFEASMYVNDIKRMGFNIDSIWRTTEINSKFEISKTYPKFHIVPAWVTDDDLKKIAQFRSLRRFPSVVWRNKSNGAVIVRSSQPELGWFGWRCEEDEHLLSAIAQAASLDNHAQNHNMTLSVTDMAAANTSQFLLLDARSYPAAVANRAKGGGCECQEYYPNCDIQFMGLPNIHAIRKSFQSVRALCLMGSDQTNWYSALEATRWLHNLSALIRSTLTIVEAIDVKSKSTLVHCSDGWDRTAQLVSLSELLLDPYYRTIKGFRVLIEREWLEFGHKFADRCGHGKDDLNERSPVFLQWLDAVHQCMKQFPDAFEFNEFFLVKLAQHVYSCLFGTFLCNTVCERRQLKLKRRTFSVWDLLLSGRRDFVNFMYDAANKKVLYPNFQIRSLLLWENMFMSGYNHNHLDGLNNSAQCMELTDSGNFTCNSTESSNKSRVLRKKFSHETLHKVEVNIDSEVDNSSVSSCTSANGHTPHAEPHKPSDVEKSACFTCNGISNGNLSESADNVISNDVVSQQDVGSTEPNKIEEKTSLNKLSGFTDNPGEAENCAINNAEIATNGNESLSLPLNANTIQEPITNPSHDEQTDHLESIANSYNETSVSKKENFSSQDSMTDSVRTLTDEVNEHRKSFDDSCVNVRSSPLSDADLVSLQHRSNGFLRAHSPESNRLQRTKSVPDVMTTSVCVNTDVARQHPSVELAQKQKDFEKDLSRYIDSDGLTLSYSFIDKKLIELHAKHSVELSRLQRRLDVERQARIFLQQQQCTHDTLSHLPASILENLQDDRLSLPDSVNGERSSVSSISNDDGWEQVQFDDVQPTRWMPDHLSCTCASCGCPFTVIYRKHHCRKCGGIFCDTCTNFKLTVPEEQLYTPVRVCAKCYESHMRI